jgi:hypothetical protein
MMLLDLPIGILSEMLEYLADFEVCRLAFILIQIETENDEKNYQLIANLKYRVCFRIMRDYGTKYEIIFMTNKNGGTTMMFVDLTIHSSSGIYFTDVSSNDYYLSHYNGFVGWILSGAYEGFWIYPKLEQNPNQLEKHFWSLVNSNFWTCLH